MQLGISGIAVPTDKYYTGRTIQTMIEVYLEQHLKQQDITVLIKYAQPDRRVKRLADYAKLLDRTVQCTQEGCALAVNAADIFYAESMDKRTFVYTQDNVYRTGMRLYQLLEMLEPCGFVQMSKYCLVNLYHLDNIKTQANSRMTGTLSNKEKITINRKYISDIKTRLQER